MELSKPEDIRREVDALITRLRELGQSVNPLDLLSRVAYYHLKTPEPGEASHTQSEAEVEYLLSLFLASPFPVHRPAPTAAQIQECIDLLHECFTQATVFYSLTSFSRSGDRWESEVIHLQRLHTLHVRGEDYGVHRRQTFLGVARPHDPFLQTAYGFTADQVLAAIESTRNSLETAIASEMEKAQEAIRPYLEAAAKEMGAGEATPEALAAFSAAHPEQAAQFKTAIDAFGGPAMFEMIPQSPAEEAILRHLACGFGDNAPFLTQLKKWVGWPLNPTLLSAKPILLHEGRFYAFHLPLLARSPLAFVERLLFEKSEAYWQNTFLSKRDLYFEQSAVDLVAAVLPGSTKHANAYYHYVEEGEARRAELDGLILYDDCALVVEVKASGLSDAARRGAPESIVTDLKASLDKGYAQALRALKLVRLAAETPFFDETGKEIFRLRFADYRRVFLVSITREQFAGLATRMYLIRKLGLIQGAEWPWAASLNDLRVIAEILDHPTLFLHYLIRRLAVNDSEKLLTVDELDLFGFFLSQGLYLHGDERFQENDFVSLDGFTDQIDAFYEAQETGGEAPKPSYPLPPKVDELLTVLETVRPRHFSSVCLQLLAHSSESLGQIATVISDAETAFEANKLTLRGSITRNLENGTLVLFSCAALDSRGETWAIGKARERKQKANADNCSVVVWQPPLSTGRIRIHIL